MPRLDLSRPVGKDRINSVAGNVSVVSSKRSFKQFALREAAFFLGLLFFGLVLLPIGIYLIGSEIFGDYGGYGFRGFFGELSGKIRAGEKVAWFLVLSPYLVWQLLRLTVLAWRLAGRLTGSGGATPA